MEDHKFKVTCYSVTVLSAFGSLTWHCCWPAGQADENKIESSPRSAAAPDTQREMDTKQKHDKLKTVYRARLALDQ